MTGLILGGDGGQTSTAVLLANTQGDILGVGQGGPANHIHQPGGWERMERSLRTAVTGAFAQANIDRLAVDSACFGMTGGIKESPDIVRKFLKADHLTSYHDVVTALAGASVAQPGIVMIAGTGAIAYGLHEDGRTFISDGWGYIMGDDGSGYDIGLKVLQAAGRAQDGRGPDTLLLRYVLKVWQKQHLLEVKALMYTDQVDRSDIARLAWVCHCAAEQGDVVAGDILYHAGKGLAITAQSVIHRLELGGHHPHVYMTGGVWRAGHWVLDPFYEYLITQTPDVNIQMAIFPQVVGALLMAHQQAGGVIDEVFLTRLRNSLPASLQNKSGTVDCSALFA